MANYTGYNNLKMNDVLICSLVSWRSW